MSIKAYRPTTPAQRQKTTQDLTNYDQKTAQVSLEGQKAECR